MPVLGLVLIACLLVSHSRTASAGAASPATTSGEPRGLLSLLKYLVQSAAARLSSVFHRSGGEDAADYPGDPGGPLLPAAASAATGPGSGSGSSRVRYRGYQLLRLQAASDEEYRVLDELCARESSVHRWKHTPKNGTADILVPPDRVAWVKDYLNDMDVAYAILSADVQRTIAFQNPPRPSKRHQANLLHSKGHTFTWKRYHRLKDIVAYQEFLAIQYPHLIKLVTIGSSSEGIPLKVMKISTEETLPEPIDLSASPGPEHKRSRGRNNSTRRTRRAKYRKAKPAVWIDAGMHAREWIAPAVALYLAMQLVERFPRNRRLVQAADWYILPVMNPDGYEYSHTVDRLWRKTRSSHESARLFFGEPCIGVDLNRNWGYHWGEQGTSDEPCHELYAGPRAFSEPESRAVSRFIMARRNDIQLYLSLHSYSQMWLLPWGHTSKRPSDYEDLYNKAQIAVDALRGVDGTNYEVGMTSDILYVMSGNSDSWAKGAAGIKYAYTVELRDRGLFGFLLPANFIIPTSKEIFAAVKALVNAIVCQN